MNELPLQELFTKLREAGLPLGIDEYQLVLRSLQAGFGIGDKAALKRLCQAVWVKSAEEKSILDYHFEQVMGSEVVTSVLEEDSENVNKSKLDENYRIIPSEISKKKTEPSSISSVSSASASPQEQKDDLQVVTSVFKATSRQVSSEFFPVTQRQMKQIWRYLHRPIREGKATELDIEATIHLIGKQGILLEPVLIPSRVNRAELLFLIDQDGSMVPFHALSQKLAETALGGGRLSRTGIYYFHNSPVEYLYLDSYHQQGELVSYIINRVCSKRTTVLIFSDAGAARGSSSEERYQLTQEFLTNLKQRVRHIAWLNPMPKNRWSGTTAGAISNLVPMFEFSRKGLQDAISVLRGRPTNFEGRKK